MRRMNTKKKLEVVDEGLAIIREWLNTTDDDLYALVEAGKAKSGCLLVYTAGENYGYKMLSEALVNDFKGVTGWNMAYYLQHIKDGHEAAKRFVEEHR